jgi:hypothetical protein
LGYNVAQLKINAMSDNSVVRARIDERTKKEAAAALEKIGLTVSDAFRLLTGARRGELVEVGKPDKLLQSLNAS